MKDNQVILVDENDLEIGTFDKLEAHRLGKLHRAFSVFIFHPDGRLLLQRRALSKYHSGGLWANTCCSHPRPGEETMEAAHRRLKEEMGFDCGLTETHAFVYKTEVSNDLIEYEYDHVFVGTWDGEPDVDAAEVADWRWENIDTLRAEFAGHPDRYAYWFKIAFEDVIRRAFPKTDL